MVTCLGVLVFFKYFNFLYESFFDLVQLFGGNGPSGYFSIILPVGISFYTFQTASYVVDVYRGSIKAERHLGYFALFVTFFPQLVAGPIERPDALLPQLRAEKRLRDVDFVGAFRFMLVGFFKKIAVADFIGIMVNATYENVAGANGLAALISTLLFSVQIYCDFSGYSDIAVGCAKLFGVNLTENFNKPYSARSIKEFWNRWHISLSSWLRDYIYFPIGGSRVKTWRWVFNVSLVFFVSGLWHGASYNFIIWGLLHALFQIIGKFTLGARNKFWTLVHISPDGKLVSRLRNIGTAALVTLAWVFFRADTPANAIAVLGKIFSDYSFGADYLKRTVEILGITPISVAYCALALIMMLVLERIKYPERHGVSRAPKFNAALRFCAYALMCWCIIGVWMMLQAADIGSSFIYFQF
jgi:D-alanyl-lipoteichoic acid acyltransferase DltB (MBOAT superfamily)